MSAEDENRFTVHRDEPGEMYAPEPEAVELEQVSQPYGWWQFADNNAGILAFIVMMVCLTVMAVFGN